MIVWESYEMEKYIAGRGGADGKAAVRGGGPQCKEEEQEERERHTLFGRSWTDSSSEQRERIMKWRLGRGCNGRPLLDAPGLAGARESGNAAQADGDLPIEGQP